MEVYIYRRLERGEEQKRQQYLALNREVRKKVRNAKREYEVKVGRKSKDNPKVKGNVRPSETTNGHITI